MFLENIEINIPNQKDTYKSEKNTADKEKMLWAGVGGLSAHHGADHGPNIYKDGKP
jgi:hypothetical protein